MAPPAAPARLAGPAERRLLAACLLLRDPAALAPLTAGVGWVGFLWLAGRQHAVEPAAHALLAAGGGLPADVRAQLAEVNAAAAARNALLLAELARAQEVLRAAGIASAALKGTALLAAHYPSIAARHLSDVDLLVRPRELPAAAAALAAAGLAPPAGALPALGGEGPLARNPGVDHVPVLATWGGALLELHDHLPGGGAAPDAVVAAARRVTWQGRALDVAAPDDLAGMLCRHVYLTHGDDRRLRARHVVDLSALSAQGTVDWRAVHARWGGGPGAGAIRRSLELVEAAQRAAAGDDAAGLDLLGAEAAGGADRARATLWRALRSLQSPGALRAVFPSRRYLAARYGVRPGSPLLPLLYPWRLLSGAVRMLGRR